MIGIQPATPVLITLLCSSLILLVLAAISWKRRYEPAGRIFLFVVLFLLIWTIGFNFEITSPSLGGKIFWANIQFFGITFLPLSLLVLCLHYTQRDKHMLRWLFWIGIIPCLTNIIIWTNPMHHLFRLEPFIETSGEFPVLHNDYGPWFYWVHSWYGYVLSGISLWLLIQAVIYSQALYRQQILTLIASISIPLLVDFLYVAGITPIPQFNFTPIVFSISGIFLAQAIFRYRLFDVAPMAKDVVFDSMAEGVIICDNAQRLIDINPAAQKLTGILPRNHIGIPLTKIFEHLPTLAEQTKNPSAEPAIIQIDQDTNARHYQIRCSPINNRRNQLVGQVIILHDITEQINLYHEIQTLATYDELTDVYNRRIFIELGQKEFLRLERHPDNLSLIMMDIDQFKLVNDTYGHQAGDQVLKTIAHICLKSIRTGDIIGRYGGEEFVILLPGANLEYTEKIANRLRIEVCQWKFEQAEQIFTVTASFGIASVREHNITKLDELLHKADQALYQAKRQGRNRVIRSG